MLASAREHSGAAQLARLLEALAHVCQADGITLSEVRSIQFADDEVSIHLQRANGCGRINTYPVAVLGVSKGDGRQGDCAIADGGPRTLTA